MKFRLSADRVWVGLALQFENENAFGTESAAAWSASLGTASKTPSLDETRVCQGNEQRNAELAS